MTTLTPRFVFSVIFLGCASLLGYGYYLQYAEGLNPCNLCIFARVCFATVGLVALLGLLHGSRSVASQVYHAIATLAALAGTGIAARHVWIQNLPEDKVPECGPGLDYLLQAFPLQSVIQTVLKGSGDCAEVTWQFLGLSIPAWTLLCFIGLVVINLAGALGIFRARA